MPKTVHDGFAILDDPDEVIKDNKIYYKDFPVYTLPGMHEAVVVEASHYLPPGAGVIDLGAGTGAFSLRLLERGFEVIAAGVEADTYGTFAVKEVPFLSLNFNDSLPEEHCGKFDAVFAIEVIEHVENIYDFCRKIHSLLKPSGVAFITTPNVCCIRSRLAFAHASNMFLLSPYHARHVGHIQAIPYWLLEFAAEKAGLELIKMIGVGKFFQGQFPSWQNILNSVACAMKKCFYKEIFAGEFSMPGILAILRKTD